jgi:hypothetical protein
MATATWEVVPCLDEGRDQLNERFPKRDKASDGSIGNQAHAVSTSSHNPDRSGKPEWKDGDTKNEVRARDFDKDLNDAETGTTMEQVVQMWVSRCRSGEMWWVRYIIYRERIWHKKDGFKTRAYTGANKHNEHVHVNSDFTQKADEAKGTDWGLKNFRRKSTTPATPKPPALPIWKTDPLVVDGVLGPKTIKRWQTIVKHKTITDKMDKDFVGAIQVFLKGRVDHRLVVDRIWGPNTTRALDRYIGSPTDGVMDGRTVTALQRRLNEGRF